MSDYTDRKTDSERTYVPHHTELPVSILEGEEAQQALGLRAQWNENGAGKHLEVYFQGRWVKVPTVGDDLQLKAKL